ncbi:tRNA (adenine-N(1)-)-methyltransferase catalytic subunit trm61, partial [Cryomyces antarcticus]
MANTPQPTTPNPFVSPLDPRTTTHLCTFSPCIEQVQRTVTAMRELGWLEIDMVEVQHRRIDVRRERVGLHEEGLRGVNASAANVDEAVSRLREVESRLKEFRENTTASAQGTNDAEGGREVDGSGKGMDKTQKEWPPKKSGAKQQRQQANVKAAEERNIFKEGRLVHRTEPELKTHTSYLAFA